MLTIHASYTDKVRPDESTKDTIIGRFLDGSSWQMSKFTRYKSAWFKANKDRFKNVRFWVCDETGKVV